MHSTPRLYNILFSMLNQLPWKDKRHLMTCVWMIIGLLDTAKINLSEWVSVVLSRAQFAQSTERRFRRFLSNERIKIHEVYAPLISEAIKNWGHNNMYIALDTSMLWNRYCLIRIVVIYRGRAVPLSWKVIEQKSSSVSLDSYKDLLVAVNQYVPQECKIVFLADRGFADKALMAFLTDELDWDWRIRYKESIGVFKNDFPDYKKLKMRACRGEARFYHNCYVTQGYHGPVHLAFARPKGSRETWIVASSEPTSMKTFEEYGFRFDIEENFLDDKSNGFQLESSCIRDAGSLERLCLILAVSTLFLVAQGTAVVDAGKRRLVDPHWKRGISYLKIGWRWIKHALLRKKKIFQHITLSSTPDPEPLYQRKLSELIHRQKYDDAYPDMDDIYAYLKLF